MKLDMVVLVVLNPMSKPVDFGFKRLRIGVRVVACESKIVPECSGCHSI